MELAQYRKIIALAVTGLLMITLKHFGMSADELIVWGTSVGEIQEAIVDFLVTIGIPGVFALAQPNERGESIFTYWRWVAAGLAVVIALILVVGLF